MLALLCEQFGATLRVASPDSGPQTSIGGMRALSDVRFNAVTADAAEVFLAIGSDSWPTLHDAAFFGLLSEALTAGKFVGEICAATVVAAGAGLFKGRPHTSNGLDWLGRHAPGYTGAEHYVETPRAVTAGRLVSAPGSAPGSFASAICMLVSPGRVDEIRANDAMMAREWAAVTI